MKVIDPNYNEFIKRVLYDIEEELWCLSNRTGETALTIFLSQDLFARIRACLSLSIANDESYTLFGCNVERYVSRGFSFYVTTAKKIKYETENRNERVCRD